MVSSLLKYYLELVYNILEHIQLKAALLMVAEDIPVSIQGELQSLYLELQSCNLITENNSFVTLTQIQFLPVVFLVNWLDFVQ